MRYLLDTHAFLWLATDDERLPAAIRVLYEAPAHEWLLSTASIWEMAIKANLGKLSLAMALPQLVQGGVERGIRLLSIQPVHAYMVETLPFHHRDPFDRMLVAQATHEGLHLVSRDDVLDAYTVMRVWG